MKWSAQEWSSGAIGFKNLIGNVSGAVWCRDHIRPEAWEIADGNPVLGDGFLNAMLADEGQIAYEPFALSYIRINDYDTKGGAVRSEPVATMDSVE